MFFVLFNVSLTYTTAARGALALSTLPLLTMVVAAALGVERLTARKTVGVLIAMGGVAVALAAGVAPRPPAPGAATSSWSPGRSAWRATACGPARSSGGRARSPFTTAGMGVGAAALALLAWWTGGFAAAGRFGPREWAAIGYLGVFGAALVFYLWAFALERTTPTRVASTITVNPVTASIVAALLLGEPIGLNLAAGVAAVFAGIWIASTERRPRVSGLRRARSG